MDPRRDLGKITKKCIPQSVERRGYKMSDMFMVLHLTSC